MSGKTRDIMRKIAELYSFGTSKQSVEEVTEINYEKLLSKEAEWEKAFDEYDTHEVIEAIENFWAYSSDKSRPSVAQLKSLLNAKKIKKATKKEDEMPKNICIESEFMSQDIKLGRHLDRNITHYRRAVDYILYRKLKDILGEETPKNIDDAKDRTIKFSKAKELGLFSDFDYILENINNIDC